MHKDYLFICDCSFSWYDVKKMNVLFLAVLLISLNSQLTGTRRKWGTKKYWFRSILSVLRPKNSKLLLELGIKRGDISVPLPAPLLQQSNGQSCWISNSQEVTVISIVRSSPPVPPPWGTSLYGVYVNVPLDRVYTFMLVVLSRVWTWP